MFTNYKLKQYLSLVVFILSLVFLSKVLLLNYFPDFTGYYYGAQYLMKGESPYVQDVRYFTQQSYPPFALIIFFPFTFFSLEFASKVWVGLSICLLLCTIYIFCRLNKVSFFSPVNLLITSLAFFSFPVKFTLGMGQVNILIVFFLTLFIHFLNSKKTKLSGLFLSFSLMIKFFPLLLIPYFIFKKKWRLVSVTLSVTAIVMVVLFYLFNNSMNYYFQYLLPDLLSSWKGDYYNQALTGFIVRITSDDLWRVLLRVILSTGLMLILLLAIFKKIKPTRERFFLEISAIITLSLLINSFSWQHHYVWLIIPFFIIFYHVRKYKISNHYLIILGVSYLLVSVNIKEPNLLPVIFQSHVLYGALVLYILNIYLLISGKKSKR